MALDFLRSQGPREKAPDGKLFSGITESVVEKEDCEKNPSFFSGLSLPWKGEGFTVCITLSMQLKPLKWIQSDYTATGCSSPPGFGEELVPYCY